jgi:signal transduction histidine kinase
MRDVANTAGLLLRGLTLNAELRERVRLAEKLEDELRASRTRVMQARDIERRRSVTEITTVTGASLAAIRTELARAGELVGEDPEAAARMLARARPALEELIERFRAVVRGVFPGVLRDDGPRVALEEFASNLPRPVCLTGDLGPRREWEIESGIYFVAAAAMRLLCRGAAGEALRVHLEHRAGRLAVRIDDPAGPAVPPTGLREALTDQDDRLAALGGGLRVDETPQCVTVLAWLPDRLQPAEASALISSVPPEGGEAQEGSELRGAAPAR